MYQTAYTSRSRNGYRGSSSYSNSNRRRSSSGGQRFRHYRGKGVDIAAFINRAVDQTPTPPHVIKHRFSDFALCQPIHNNLKYRKFTTPTPIQDQAIQPILEGKDLIGLANTGTGKTAAFLLPLINKVYNDPSQKVLIIAPTRELAQQIEDEFRLFAYGMKIFSVTCVGGMPMYKQIGNLRRNPNFVIGTPGRLIDLGKRGNIRFSQFNNVIIDEIDRMLDMGFIEDITTMLDQVSTNRQSLFFSATMPDKIRSLIGRFANNPVTVEVKSGETAQNVEQNVIKIIDKNKKFDQLHELLNQPDYDKVLIFNETKRDVERLTNELVASGFKADSIHGNKSQSQRTRALKSFKDGYTKILVATDVAARGLDIKEVTHVINYSAPQTYDDYIHRIGRTGRGDCKGKALTFIE